jgi:thiol-disulfide isomerase/thioredoxin
MSEYKVDNDVDYDADIEECMTVERIREIRRLINNKKPTVLFFTWDQCGPCKLVKSVLDKLVRDQVIKEYFTLDIAGEAERGEHLPSQFAVGHVPSVLLFSQGVEFKRFKGIPGNRESELEDAIAKAMHTHKVMSVK